ncbi:hypothetical protein B0I26_10364 [Anoxybacillus vitaminiphilus]|uniref:Uncharacterized protein n=1 Tax=Paranoxybacillus vitaminiphilus TaxID=581036 RepID=A0A327YL27_9BACL|nr:hypothetical protein [Anoxybacillus vitaminiphilus]RAK21112.1 hypothetical protein B0I26_10364 [Anoxybacillus vitaminiphilus]
MNITIEIKAPELAASILALASALDRRTGSIAKATEVLENAKASSPTAPASPIGNTTQLTPAQQATVQQSVPTAVPTAAPTTPVQQPAQQPTQQAEQLVQQPVQQAPQPVPTSAPSYTLDQLAVAATQLVDAGRREELVQLLSSFGVQALTALPKEQYGAFATKLREMGAKI